MCFLTVLEFRSLESRWWQGCAPPSEVLGEKLLSLPSFCGLSPSFGMPWLTAPSFQALSAVPCLLSRKHPCFCVSSPLLVGTPVKLGLGVTLPQHALIVTNDNCKDSICILDA